MSDSLINRILQLASELATIKQEELRVIGELRKALGESNQSPVQQTELDTRSIDILGLSAKSSLTQKTMPLFIG